MSLTIINKMKIAVCTNTDQLSVVKMGGLVRACMARNPFFDLISNNFSFINVQVEQLGEDTVVEKVKECRILLVDPALIVDLYSHCNGKEALANIEWIHASWAGVNSMFEQNATGALKFASRFSKSTPPIISRSGGVMNPYMTEYVIGKIIEKIRRFEMLHEKQRELNWIPIFAYKKIADLRIGVMGGTGDLGGSIVKALYNFNCKSISILKRTKSETTDFGANVFSVDELASFLEPLDVIVSVIPSTKDTFNLLGNKMLQSCKQSPLLINTGRGSLIDEESVIEAIDNQWISCAVLDVHAIEPLPITSPLWTHPKVDITPHISAISFAQDVAEIFTTNLELFILHQLPLKYQVDATRGY